MNILIFDTETVNLEKPFCYNIGYVIYDTLENKQVLRKEFVVEQIWHNLPLFSTAYYNNKREIYVSRMRGKHIKMMKWGYIMREMCKDIEDYEIAQAYAYNSDFDERVFEHNCEWFKTVNPFDNVAIFDIRGYVHQFIAFNKDFQMFCDRHELYTDGGNYSTTAETIYRYVSGETDFAEEHTALADSLIELEILLFCLEQGAYLGGNFKVYQSIPRQEPKSMKIIVDGVEEFCVDYKSKRVYKDKICFYTE